MSNKRLWLTIGALTVVAFAAGWAVRHQGWVYPRNIVVDVRGDVERPGLYTLHGGSRVADAIKAAGGMAGRKGRVAGLKGFVSFAEMLSDGEMIAVDVPQSERWENIPVEEGGTLTADKAEKIRRDELRGLEQQLRPKRVTVPEDVIVDVTGAVARPGVYTLPHGSRVVDAIKAAGGLASDADESLIIPGRASSLYDGETVRVPRKSKMP